MRIKDSGIGFLVGVGVGAVVMYFLDPSQGARRRTVTRDKAGRYARDGARALQGRARHLRNRAHGAVAAGKRALNEARGGDAAVAGRVRNALGRVVCHSGNITVDARDGEVTLTGKVYEQEYGALQPVAGGVRGVRRVVNRTEVEADALW